LSGYLVQSIPAGLNKRLLFPKAVIVAVMPETALQKPFTRA
jgi:hypothetical protein